MNEGIGKVLRFGAYDSEVVNRLKWMQTDLAPSTFKNARTDRGRTQLNATIARAVTMGDEFHQRNIAASALLVKELVPYLVNRANKPGCAAKITRFLADTDQFFLNVRMAT